MDPRRTFLALLVLALLLGGASIIGPCPAGAASQPLGPVQASQDGFDFQLLLYVALGLSVVGLLFTAVLVVLKRRRGGAPSARKPAKRTKIRLPRAATPARKPVEGERPAEATEVPKAPRAQEPIKPAVPAWPREDRAAAAPPPPVEEAPAPEPEPVAVAPAPAAPPPQVDQQIQEGIARIKGGDAAAGYTLLRQVIQQSPRNAEAWLWLGWAAVKQNNATIAERCFQQAQEFGHPQAGQALQWLKSRRA